MDLKLEPFLHEKTLVFTVTSDGYKYYTWNLYKLLERCKVPWKPVSYTHLTLPTKA